MFLSLLLQHYYKIGYGHAINYEMSCPLVADIFQNIDDFINGNQYVYRFILLLILCKCIRLLPSLY